MTTNDQTLLGRDEWGNFNQEIGNIIFGINEDETEKFTRYFESNPDSAIMFHRDPIFKEKGILVELRELNDPVNIRKGLGNYLIGLFKYESKDNDFLGVDFETGRWFSRNLKIFRNIQRNSASPDDRILVIYGSAHMNLLNYLFECSPEYELVDVSIYLY